jgi:TolB-like protein/Tfp pilus assembly protein PilF
MSPDAQDNYFADGMTEELISTLAKIGNLAVIARTSVFKYKDGEKSVAEIAAELRVGSVLEGSIRKSENRLRISIQLVDTASETYLWSEEYDRDDQDVFLIQRDIAESVAEALKVQLLTTERQQVEKQATANIEAHNLYLRGRYNLDPFAEDGFKKVMRARAYFERALELDPEFALAYVGLADSYYFVSNVHMPPHEAMPKAREAAQKALDLDPQLGEAHAVLATVLALYDWNWSAAETAFQKAVAFNPNYASVHHLYGIYLVFQKRYEEAATELDLAHQLDPLSVSIENTAVWPHIYKMDLDEAIRRLRTIIDAEPTFSPAHMLLADTYFLRNQPSQAIDELELAARLSGPAHPDVTARLCQGYAKAGMRTQAVQVLEELERRLSRGEHIPAYILAKIYAALGDTKLAFAWLENAYEERAEELPFIRIESEFEVLRSDPRYKSLVAKMGFE